MNDALASLRTQWQANRRLRIAIGLAALIAALHLAVVLSESRAATIERYLADRALLGRLEGAAADASWAQRADEAREALEAMEATMDAAAGAGEAQAELQALLTGIAGSAGLQAPRARSEAAIEVDGMPTLWQVVARLDATAPAGTLDALLLDLSRRPWVRVERIEVRDGTPAQVQLIVRAYLRRADEAAP